MHILHLDSTARGDLSLSKPLAAYLAEKLQSRHSASITHRDIAQGLPYIDAQMVGAYYTPAENRSDEQHAAIALSDTLVDELEAADVIVAAVPMYNFAAPASFKAWVDLVARVGRTFRYTDAGPQGLLKGKTFYAVVATGGTPLGGEADFVTPYLRHVLAFMGVTDVRVVAADQFNRDAEAKLAQVRQDIDTLLAEAA